MPETNAIERIVLRKDPLTEEEWLELVHLRKKSVGRVLNQVVLPDLRHVEYGDPPYTLDAFFTSSDLDPKLKTQGLYGSRALIMGSHYVLWGLTRNQYWIACTFQENNEFHRTLKSASINVTEALDPRFLLEHGVCYHDMLRLMSDALPVWIEQQRRQLQTLEQLAQQFEHEDGLIKPFAASTGP